MKEFTASRSAWPIASSSTSHVDRRRTAGLALTTDQKILWINSVHGGFCRGPWGHSVWSGTNLNSWHQWWIKHTAPSLLFTSRIDYIFMINTVIISVFIAIDLLRPSRPSYCPSHMYSAWRGVLGQRRCEKSQYEWPCWPLSGHGLAAWTCKLVTSQMTMFPCWDVCGTDRVSQPAGYWRHD